MSVKGNETELFLWLIFEYPLPQMELSNLIACHFIKMKYIYLLSGGNMDNDALGRTAWTSGNKERQMEARTCAKFPF